ncbi:hypothetical protein [Dactylosporangium sp. CA-139066]|uniref:hypothetical protein n=1 Tax=Dactylosporangium sp. CA-139066 TaxID=3239930 RepID=UPI003D8A0970
MRGSTIRNSILASALLAAGLGLGGCKTAADASTQDTRPFVACMRSHGLPDFPEVTVSSDGLVNFDIRNERVDARSEKYGAAVNACQSLLPDGTRLPGAPAAPVAPSLP